MALNGYFIGKEAGAVAYRPCGRMVAVSSGNSIVFFDLQKKENVKWFRDLTESPKYLEFIASGTELLNVAFGELSFINYETLARISRIPEFENYFTPNGLALSPDGRKAFVAGNYGFGAVIDLTDRKLLTRVKFSENEDEEGSGEWELTGALWSSDGTSVSSVVNNQVWSWNSNTGDFIETKVLSDADAFRGSISPDGQLKVIAENRELRLISTEDGSVKWKKEMGALSPESVAFSPDGNQIIMTSRNPARTEGRLYFLNLENGEEIIL